MQPAWHASGVSSYPQQACISMQSACRVQRHAVDMQAMQVGRQCPQSVKSRKLQKIYLVEFLESFGRLSLGMEASQHQVQVSVPDPKTSPNPGRLLKKNQ